MLIGRSQSGEVKKTKSSASYSGIVGWFEGEKKDGRDWNINGCPSR